MTARTPTTRPDVHHLDVVVDRHLTTADRHDALAQDVRTGLTTHPRELPPKWFYDATGGMLFEKITKLPEYYPTRREHAILTARAGEIAAACPADTLVELGSGASVKTRLLLDALRDTGSLRHFTPFDVDEEMLLGSGQAIMRSYPGVSVHAVVGDFEHHLAALPADAGRRLVAFLGSTIGNLRPGPRADFLRTLRGQLRDGDALLLGTDLVKDVGRLVAAYNDRAGVTAAFNRNVLSVINRELGGDFDLRGFAHVAVWDPENAWIEMRLRSVRGQQARVRALDLLAEFDADEEMLTEISAKFTLDRVTAEFDVAGLKATCQWMDPDGDFALTLAEPV